MEKYKNKYRIPSARAQWWDYGNNAAYFVTICTQHRVHYFGEIDAMNRVSTVAETIWHEIPEHYPFIELGAFVVMPNHIHGIIVINKSSVTTTATVAPQRTGGFAGDKNPMLNENLSRIVRWYKGRTTFECRKMQANFSWQSRFHDHIIRNDAEYQRINDYIESNPANWENDTFFKTEEL